MGKEFGHDRVSATPENTDGRQPGDWQSRYPEIAARRIFWEATYLAALLLGLLCCVVLVSLNWPAGWLRIPPSEYLLGKPYALGFLAGDIGGTLFSLKWLYHSVARNLWNQDRGLWRVFTPHVSGVLALGTISLLSSGLLRMFDAASMSQVRSTLGIGFLIGYFSDSAVAKLSELAVTLFGAAHPNDESKGPKTKPNEGCVHTDEGARSAPYPGPPLP